MISISALRSIARGCKAVFVALSLWACDSSDPPEIEAPVSGRTADPSGVVAQAPDRNGPFEFGRVLDGGLLPDGGFFAIDAFEPAIHRFGPDGSWEARVIQDGAGPGEFRYPLELGFRAGGGWLLWDGELQRALELDSTLEVVDHLSREQNGTRIIGRVPDGRELQVRFLSPGPGDPVSTAPVLLVLRDRAAASDSVIDRLYMTIDEADDSGQPRRVLLAPEFLWATTPEGAIVAHTHENEVRWIRPGKVDVSVESSLDDGSGADVSEAQKDAIRQEAVEDFQRVQSDPDGPLAQVFVRVVENARVEDVWPTIDDLVGTGDGRAWVRRPPRPGEQCAKWEAISPEGQRTRYDLPRFTRILDSLGDRILLLSRGELDEHFVSVTPSSALPTCAN